MLLQSPFNNCPEKLNLHSTQRVLHYITIPAPSQCVSTYIRSPTFLNINAISWAAVASLSQQRATCPRLRLTLQMHWSTPSCFSVLPYPLSMSFDRLVNNAGGLWDDNQLGGKARTHKIMHTHLFSFFFFLIYLSISLSYAPGVWLISDVFKFTLWYIFFSPSLVRLSYLQFTPSSALVIDTNTEMYRCTRFSAVHWGKLLLRSC